MFLKKLVFILLLASPCFSLTLFPEQASSSELLPFSVNPLLPDNQSKQTHTFFNLEMTENKKQILWAEVKNQTNKPLTLSVESANALSTKNGGIYYTTEKVTPYSSFTDETYSLASFIEVKDTLSLKPQETKKIAISLTSPPQAAGTYLGGVIFSATEDTTTQLNEDQLSVEVQNKLTYSLAIQLNYSAASSKNTFSFGNSDLELTPSGVIFLISLHNKCACIPEIDYIHFKVSNEKKEVVFEGNTAEIKMAPKTQINYSLFWEGTPLSHGVYTVDTAAHIGGTIVKDTKQFTVKEKELNEYIQKVDEQEVVLVENVIPYWFWLIILLFVLCCFFLGRMIRKYMIEKK